MHHIGQYATEEEAARAFDAAAVKEFGNDTPQNFPTGALPPSPTFQQPAEAAPEEEVRQDLACCKKY